MDRITDGEVLYGKEELDKIYSSVARSNAWDVSTAVYLQVFSVSAQEITPSDIFFKPDGMKMYVMGSTGDDINEYDLSTPWDVSTAVYLQAFSIAAQELTPKALFFKPDGTKMYVMGSTGDDINEYDLSTPWDVSTAVYLQVFSVSAQEITPSDMFFKPDGMKMYVMGSTGDDINEYDLSTPWDVSTAVYLQAFSISAQETNPNGIFFKPDGSKMYVMGSEGNDVNEYDLSTPWDVSTAVYLQAFSIAAQETTPTGIFFKPDGSKMYVVGIVGDDVNEYDLIDIASIVISKELIGVENETSKHTVSGAGFHTGSWKEAEYYLDITSFTETGGANPVTIDVKIQTYDPATGKWRDAMVFQQLSCAASGSETTHEYKRLASNLGVQQRVTYTTAGAGTIGDCDFKVGVVYKR